MPTYLQSLNKALHEAFACDGRVFLLGEDILDPYGGAFKVSAGLSTAYPNRVLTTPISEGAITGVAAGMALRGLRPVVEIMFGDFLTLCTDQIVNHISKFPAMYDGKVTVPMVLRTPMGGGRGYGPTHSQSIEKLLLGVPNIRVVAPSHAHDPGALLLHAILHDSMPTLFIEHKLLYPLPLLENGGALNVRMEEEESGYSTALVTNYSGGSPDLTVIAYGGVSRLLLPLMETLQAEEVRVLAAFPSSLQPVPIETLAKAAVECGQVILVEEGTAGFNWGSEVSSLLYERLWRQLRGPIRRVSSDDAIVPTATHLEDAMLVSARRIEESILEALA